MHKTLFLIAIVLVCAWPASARPTKQELEPQQNALSRQKRQSDQRLAELETLLALQKYGRHRFRMDRKKGVDGEHPPGYGIIDFRMLGRKKKSLRFSPGELATNSLQEGRSTFEKESPFSWMLRDGEAEENGESVSQKKARIHQLEQILREDEMTRKAYEYEREHAPLFDESEEK